MRHTRLRGEDGQLAPLASLFVVVSSSVPAVQPLPRRRPAASRARLLALVGVGVWLTLREVERFNRG